LEFSKTLGKGWKIGPSTKFTKPGGIEAAQFDRRRGFLPEQREPLIAADSFTKEVWIWDKVVADCAVFVTNLKSCCVGQVRHDEVAFMTNG